MEPTVVDDAIRWRMRRMAVASLLVALCFIQAPGKLVGDTKLDLTQNPTGFLERALHMWDATGFGGQVQNQAYGYLFPIGPLHALGRAAGLPDWVIQRLWWAIILVVAFYGMTRLAAGLTIGSPGVQLLAGVAYALSPRILSTVGPVSAETWPMALAPWVVVPLLTAAAGPRYRRPVLLSALAVALMGGVNAALTLAALLPGALYLLTRKPSARSIRMLLWWVGAVIVGCLWWLVPLFLLGRYSPPFLDYIESAATTTSQTSALEVLRGASHWVAYLGPQLGSDWQAGHELALEPLLILNTVVVIALGFLGMSLPRLPERGWLVTCLVVGLVLLTMGHQGNVVGSLSPDLRDLLDGMLAPLRNVHKFDPLVRIPLVLGLAHAVHAIRRKLAETSGAELLSVGITGIAVVAVLGSASPAIAGRVAPDGAYAQIPAYWQETANWLDEHAAGRSLLVPGSRFATYVWGNPQDEPLQVLSRGSWEVRNAVPLVPAGHIRMLDRVEEALAGGVASPGLSAYLASAGISHLVVRNDLRPGLRGVTPAPVLHEVLRQSPGFTPLADFGPEVSVPPFGGDDLLTPARQMISYPAVEIWSVDEFTSTTAVTSVDDVRVVVGGPESLLDVADTGYDAGVPSVLAAQRPTWFPARSVVVTDGLRRRLVDFGLTGDNHTATLTRDQAEAPRAAADDYRISEGPRWGSHLVWLGARDVQVSSSEAELGRWPGPDAAQGPAAAFDDSTDTAWLADDADPTPSLTAFVAEAVAPGQIRLTLPASTAASIEAVRVETDGGTVDLPVTSRILRLDVLEPTTWLRLTLQRRPGVTPSIGLADVSVGNVDITPAIAVPASSAELGSPDGMVFTAAPGHRNGCVGASPVTCAPELSRTGEDDGGLVRLVNLASSTTMHVSVTAATHPGEALNSLIQAHLGAGVVARASSQLVPDPLSGPLAAVDGDTGTAWVADVRDAEPRLDLSWGRPRVVRGLAIEQDDALTASFPTKLRIRVGGDTYVRSLVGGDPVRFPPVRTTRIEVTITEALPSFAVNDEGTARILPAGVSELTVRGVERPFVDRNEPVELACGSGPDVSVDGRTVATSVTTNLDGLMRGEPLPVTLCSAPTELGPGTRLLALHAEPAWRPVRLSLSRDDVATTETASTVGSEATSWEDTHRVIDVADRSTASLLTIRENVNPGWRAELEGEP
ncbi:MAG: alpha-(1-_3)-arabinofuranosyltransferase, partial [Nocardioidaceae bacterium]